MKSLILGVLCAIGWAATAGAAPDAQVSAPIHQFVDSFNKGDMKAAAATHAETDLAIIDEVPPYLWQGTGAVQAWSDDLGSDAAKRGITDQIVTLGEQTREEISGDRAYVVMSAVYTFKERGVSMREPAHMTFALQKGAAGWRISGWTWSGPKPEPAAAPAN